MSKQMESPKAWGALGEYLVDAAQRTILFWDLLRQRSEQYYAHKANPLPHVLTFDAELVLDARTFDKPVNYLLASTMPVPPCPGRPSSNGQAPDRAGAEQQ